MSYYCKMYSIMFNAVSDALDELDKLNIGMAKDYLKEAQFHTEEIYMAQNDKEPVREEEEEDEE